MTPGAVSVSTDSSAGATTTTTRTTSTARRFRSSTRLSFIFVLLLVLLLLCNNILQIECSLDTNSQRRDNDHDNNNNNDRPTFSSSPLICTPEQDGSMLCQFRIENGPTRGSSDDDGGGEVKTRDIITLEDCPTGYDYCIHATVSSSKFLPAEDEEQLPQKVKEEEEEEEEEKKHEKMTTTAESTTDDATIIEEHSTEEHSHHQEQEQIVRVRLATYRPPWAQYGELVKQTLAEQPITTSLLSSTSGSASGSSSSSSTLLNIDEGTIIWANWYFDMASAHLDKYQTVSSMEDLDSYELELALNAFQQVVTTLGVVPPPPSEVSSSSSSSDTGSLLLKALSSLSSASPTVMISQANLERFLYRDNLLASVYTQMGDLNLMHPERSSSHNMVADALYNFQKAFHVYSELKVVIQSVSTVAAFPLHPHDQMTIHIHWANTATRISSILVSYPLTDTQQFQENQQQQQQPQAQLEQATALLDSLSTHLKLGSGKDDDIQHNQQQQQEDHHETVDRSTTTTTTTTSSMDRQDTLAEQLLDQSIQVYRKYLNVDPTVRSTTIGPEELARTQTSLATALQSAATLGSVHGRLQDSKTWLLEALDIHKTHLLPYYPEEGAESYSSKISVADILLTLAGVYLSLGEYDDAKQYYSQALEWHMQYDLDVAPLSVQSPSSSTSMDPDRMDGEGTDSGGEDEILQSYLDVLEEYHTLVEGRGGGGGRSRRSNIYDGTASGGHGAGEDYYYERNDGYEADLHINVASLYLAQGELERAKGHLEVAVELCEGNDDGKQVCPDRHMAEAKLNLATVLYHLRYFSESIRMHLDALDLYYDLYGPGVNPLLESMVEYEEALVGGLGGVEGQQKQNPQQEEEGGQYAAAASTAGSSSSRSVSGKERLIDIGRYKQTVMNATAAAASASKDMDEL